MKNKFIVLLFSSLLILLSACSGGGTADTNEQPLANAGADKNVLINTDVTLDSSASTDPDNDTLSYSWQLTVPGGSAVALSPAESMLPNPTFTVDVTGQYIATLTVNDGTSDSTSDSVTITGVTPNIVFLSSTQNDGNLSGLASADNVCQTLATSAGLPGSYVAWLSDSNDDAYCRVHGLTGKKGACQPANSSVQAGPWIRTDGTPFADTIDQMLDPTFQVYASPFYFEDGTSPSSNTDIVLTGTDKTGVDTGYNCLDWSSSAGTDIVSIGNPHTTGNTWTAYGGTDCSNSTTRLLCLQTGTGNQLPDLDKTQKKIFVSSEIGNGDLSTWTSAGGNTGIAAADAVCQTLAANAGLNNTANFKAWLSMSGINAIDRINSNGPWTRVDGISIADNKTDLTDNTLFAPINVTESGSYITTDSVISVFTGSNNDGTATADNCSDWSGTVASSTLGGVNTQHYWSTWRGTGSCGNSSRLFCIED